MKHLLHHIILVIFLIALSDCAFGQSQTQWLSIGQRQLDQDKLDSARMSFNLALESDNINDKILAIRGLLKVTNFATEMNVGDSLINIGDQLCQSQVFNKPVFLFELAKAGFYRKNSQYQKALDIFKKVMPKAKTLSNIDLEYAAGLQSYGLVYEKFSRFDSSAILMEQASQLFIKNQDSTSLRYGLLCNNMGTAYLRMSDLSNAKASFEKALNVISNLKNPALSDIAMIKGNLATIYSREGDYQEAIRMTEDALALNKSVGDEDGMAYNYYSLGVDNYYLGDYGRTKDYMQQCIRLRSKIYNDTHSSLIGAHEVTAIALQESGDYKGSMQSYLAAQKIIKYNFKTPGDRAGYNLENIALNFQQIGQLDSALIYIIRSNEILEGILPAVSFHRAVHYFSMGNIYVNNGQVDEGLKWLVQALQLMEQLDLQEEVTNALIKVTIGGIEADKQNWQAADKEYEEALQIIGVDDQIDPETMMISPDALEIFDHYMVYLYKKYKELEDEKYLDQYEKFSATYLDLSERLRRQFNDPYTKSSLVKNSIPVFRTQIGIYSSLYSKSANKKYLENLFQQAEYSRATMLRDMQDEKVATYARVDQVTLDEEKALKQKLSAANEDYFTYPDSLDIKNNLFEAKEALNQFISQASTLNPQYFDLKYGGAMPSISETQDQLSDEQVLIEYMIDDTAYYALYLTNAESGMTYLGIRTVIDEYIVQYHDQISNNKPIDAEVTKFLYDHIWQPIPAITDHQRVIICPISTLYYLNLETLRNDSSGKYLLETHNISYTLSANIFLNKNFHKKQSKSLAIAIAPGFEDELKNQYQSALDTSNQIDDEFMHTIRQPWSIKLAKKLKAEYKNKACIGHMANETQVKSSLSQGNIIYFGTHAITNEHDPLRSKLVLSKSIGNEADDGYLHAYEIYGLDLAADLTILSACESGIGQIEEGEGMISLAHSIHYAGCPSTVLSLWKVDEKSNTKLIETFLENIAKGQIKSEALRNAKLDFIKHHQNAHPYLWAGMILMGQDGQVALAKQNQFVWYFMALLFLIILIFYLSRKK